MQSKPITPTSAPDEGDIFSEEGSYIRSDVHHASNGLHSDEELDLFTGNDTWYDVQARWELNSMLRT